MPYERETVTCACCGKQGPLAGRGLIRPCYMRHRQNGTLNQFARERTGQGQQRRTVECVCCGTEGPHIGRGLIQRCHNRHALAGRLEEFPLNPGSANASLQRGQETRLQAYAGRLEDFAELLSWGESPEQAAKRLGISEKTARKYERRLREQRLAVAS